MLESCSFLYITCSCINSNSEFSLLKLMVDDNCDHGATERRSVSGAGPAVGGGGAPAPELGSEQGRAPPHADGARAQPSSPPRAALLHVPREP